MSYAKDLLRRLLTAQQWRHYQSSDRMFAMQTKSGRWFALGRGRSVYEIDVREKTFKFEWCFWPDDSMYYSMYYARARPDSAFISVAGQYLALRTNEGKALRLACRHFSGAKVSPRLMDYIRGRPKRRSLVKRVVRRVRVVARKLRKKRRA